MKNYLNALSVVFLGVCFIIGCWLISNSFNENNVKAPSSFHQNHQLLTRSELAEYLGISETDVDKMGPQSIGVGITTSVVPYVKIRNITYFPLKAIDSWLLKTEAVTVQ